MVEFEMDRREYVLKHWKSEEITGKGRFLLLIFGVF